MPGTNENLSSKMIMSTRIVNSGLPILTSTILGGIHGVISGSSIPTHALIYGLSAASVNIPTEFMFTKSSIGRSRMNRNIIRASAMALPAAGLAFLPLLKNKNSQNIMTKSAENYLILGLGALTTILIDSSLETYQKVVLNITDLLPN